MSETTSKREITIIVNRKEEAIEEGTTVEMLLQSRGMKARTAVWINGTQLLLAEYPTHVVQQNDQMKILRVVAGG